MTDACEEISLVAHSTGSSNQHLNKSTRAKSSGPSKRLNLQVTFQACRTNVEALTRARPRASPAKRFSTAFSVPTSGSPASNSPSYITNPRRLCATWMRHPSTQAPKAWRRLISTVSLAQSLQICSSSRANFVAELLTIEKTASGDQIKKAYRKVRVANGNPA